MFTVHFLSLNIQVEYSFRIMNFKKIYDHVILRKIFEKKQKSTIMSVVEITSLLFSDFGNVYSPD